MSSSPEMRENPQDGRTGQHQVAAPDSGGSCAQVWSPTLERRRPPPSTPLGHLEQLPAITLLSRLSTPTVAVGLDGALVYVNAAFATMLGYADASALVGQPLSNVMSGRADTPPNVCVAALRDSAGTVCPWRHVDGYPVHAVVSRPLLSRSTDPLLLVTLADVSDLMWNS
jgi:PAS domain-containing protein